MNIIESEQWAQWVREALENKSAMDVVTLDLRKLSAVTDFFIVATGTSTPHLKALAHDVERAMRTHGVRGRTSGTAESHWVVIDFVDVVVHLFEAETRAYYALEQLWGDAPTVTS